MKIGGNKGLVFLIVLILILLLVIAAASFMLINSSEIKMAESQTNSTKAFYIAEAGIQTAMYELYKDFKNDATNPSWADGDINGVDVTKGGTVTIPQNRNNGLSIDDPSQPFYAMRLSVSCGGGDYSISLLNVSGKDDEIYIKSTGVYKDGTRTVVILVRSRTLSPWDTAIFGGAGGAGGVLINGNVNIAGSVHLLGSGLTAADYAIDMSGSSGIKNNYDGIPVELSSRIPSCPTTFFNGETIESLDATLCVQNGLVGLSGSATAGEVDATGNIYKETLDGVFVTDGYGGTSGADGVYSDNGAYHSYDLGVGDSAAFPSLSDSYTDPGSGTTYATYMDFLSANALVISSASDLNELDSITPSSNFNFTDGTNTIAMDGSGNLTVSGIVYIQGGDFNMNKKGSDKTIIYSGSGLVVAEGDGNSGNGDVNLNTNLLTSNTFPTSDVLGIITPGGIEFNAANIDVMGAFYAETEISVSKQTDIAGTLVSNHVDMGSNVPSVFQVPSLADNLPYGMIDMWNAWVVFVRDWQEI